MTDKQIIDGIDVSKCQHYGKYSIYCYAVEEPCSDNPNCYYKQLKSKEQECEELRIYIESNEQQVKEVETLVMDNDILINELDQLKQTLTEIKEIANKVLLNTHDLEQFKDADALFGALLEIHKKISEYEVENE